MGICDIKLWQSIEIFIPVKPLIKAKEAASLYHLLASQLLSCFASWLAWWFFAARLPG